MVFLFFISLEFLKFRCPFCLASMFDALLIIFGCVQEMRDLREQESESAQKVGGEIILLICFWVWTAQNAVFLACCSFSSFMAPVAIHTLMLGSSSLSSFSLCLFFCLERDWSFITGYQVFHSRFAFSLNWRMVYLTILVLFIRFELFFKVSYFMLCKP